MFRLMISCGLAQYPTSVSLQYKFKLSAIYSLTSFPLFYAEMLKKDEDFQTLERFYKVHG